MTKGNNSGLSIIADRYAVAMTELAEKLDRVDVFENDLEGVNNLFSSNKEIIGFLSHPTIPLEDKKATIESTLRNAVSDQVLSLLKLLLDRNRICIFPSIVNHYKDIINKKRNISVAKVTTAIEIDEDIVNRLKQKLEQAFNANIKINLNIDPSIIAGMVVEIGDKIIDGSIKTRLENMKRQLM